MARRHEKAKAFSQQPWLPSLFKVDWFWHLQIRFGVFVQLDFMLITKSNITRYHGKTWCIHHGASPFLSLHLDLILIFLSCGFLLNLTVEAEENLFPSQALLSAFCLNGVIVDPTFCSLSDFLGTEVIYFYHFIVPLAHCFSWRFKDQIPNRAQ